MRPTGRTALLIIVLVLAAPLYAAAADRKPDADPGGPAEKTRFEYAKSLYMQGAYDSAVAEFKGFVKDFPRGEYSDDAYYWLGKYYLTAGSYDEALDQFKTAMALLPSGDMAPAVQLEIARYYSEPTNPKHDREKAVAEYMKIPFFYPDSPLVDDAAYYAALCQAKLGRHAQAEEVLRAFGAKYPASEFAAPAGFQLGMSCVMQGKQDEALLALQAVRDNYPAGLYRQKALDAIELIMRTKEKRPLKLSFAYGVKGSAPGMFSKPSDLTTDGEGSVYVSDSGNIRVQRFNALTGTLQLESSSIASPTLEKNLRMSAPAGVAVGPKGRVYVTDSSADRVQVFEPDGSLVMTFGRKGHEAGDMYSPGGIAVDEGGNIYVADQGNGRVEKFDDKGRFITAIGNTGQNTENGLAAPCGVALDLEGNLLVTDTSKDKAFKYDPSGNLVMVFGDDPQAKRRLNDPAGIGVDLVGNVYIAERGGRSVAVFDRQLRPLTVYSGESEKGLFDKPAGLAVTGAGVVYVADTGLNQVVVLK